MEVYNFKDARKSIKRLLKYTDGAPAQFPVHPYNDVAMLEVFVEKQQNELEELHVNEDWTSLSYYLQAARDERDRYKSLAEAWEAIAKEFMKETSPPPPPSKLYKVDAYFSDTKTFTIEVPAEITEEDEFGDFVYNAALDTLRELYPAGAEFNIEAYEYEEVIT